MNKHECADTLLRHFEGLVAGLASENAALRHQLSWQGILPRHPS